MKSRNAAPASALHLLLWLGIVAAFATQALDPHSRTITWLSSQASASARQAALDSQESLALAAQVWRRGLDWNTLTPVQQDEQRQLMRQSLRDDRSIRFARQISSTDVISEMRARRSASDESVLFQRMLDYAPGRYQEALLHGAMTEAQFLDTARDHASDELWLLNQANATPGEAEARQWYDTHRTRLQAPHVYRAAHIFLTAHEPGKPKRGPEMQAIAARLGNEPWNAVAAATSEDERTKRHGGDLGWFTESRMPAHFVTAVKALKSPGQTSPIIRTTLGWHLIKLLDTRPAHIPEFDEVKEEIAAMLRNQHRTAALKQQVAQIHTIAYPVASPVLRAQQ